MSRSVILPLIDFCPARTRWLACNFSCRYVSTSWISTDILRDDPYAFANEHLCALLLTVPTSGTIPDLTHLEQLERIDFTDSKLKMDSSASCPAGSSATFEGAASGATQTFDQAALDWVADCNVVFCFACPRGKYRTSGDKRRNCKPCSLGRSCPNANNIKDGALCPTGYYCPRPINKIPISNGFVAKTTAGGNGVSTGATLVEPCNPGKYKDDPTTTSCKLCPLGKYFPESAAGSCRDCPPGRFGNVQGLTSDLCSGPCPPGYSSDKGKTECTRCNPGTYAVPDKTTCRFCETDADRYGKGFTSDAGSDICVCNKEYYLDTEKSKSCEPCPKGTSCKSVGATLRTLPVTNGFWRARSSTSTVYKCPQPKACLGSITNTTSSTTTVVGETRRILVASPSTANTNDSATPCLAGNGGVLCAVCDPGFARYGARDPCKQCGTTGAAWAWTIFAAVLVGVVLFAVIFINRRSPSGLLRPVIDLVHRLTVMLMFTANWPSALVDLGNFLSGILGGNIIEFVSPACIGLGDTYYSRFGISIGVLIIVLAVIWIKALFKIRRVKDSPPLNESNAVPGRGIRGKMANKLGLHDPRRMAPVFVASQDSIIILLLLYPGISGHAMQFFRCNKVDGVRYLMIDYQLQCDDGVWFVYLVLVVLVLIFLAVGMPALMLWTLFKNRALIRAEAEEEEKERKEKENKRKSEEGETKNTDIECVAGSDDADGEQTTTKKKGALWILYHPYKPERYYYESIKMLFKLGLWVALALFSEGSEMQLAFALIINVFQLVVHVQLQPLRGTDVSPAWLLNSLETGTLVLTCFINFTGFATNYLEVAKEAYPERLEEITASAHSLNVVAQILAFTQVAALAVTIIRSAWHKRAKYKESLIKHKNKAKMKASSLKTRMSRGSSRASGASVAQTPYTIPNNNDDNAAAASEAKHDQETSKPAAAGAAWADEGGVELTDTRMVRANSGTTNNPFRKDNDKQAVGRLAARSSDII